jgi:signal transduction histidine kinase
MRERALELGGHLEIESSAGRGARIRFHIPVDGSAGTQTV